MEIKKVNLVEWPTEAYNYIKNGLHGVNYAVTERPMVLVHKANHVDSDICNELGYEIYETHHNGGVIVSNAGDVGIAHFGHPKNGWRDKFIAYFIMWLKAKGLNAEYDNNDIIVDGYKVCGSCTTRYGCIDYTAGVISLNVNLDHIKAICKKPMVKVPKGLSEYGITSEEVEQMFLAFCEADNKNNN